MTNQQVLEQILHLPIAERVEIIEKVSRSVREDLTETKNDFEKRNRAYQRLRGIAKVEGKNPPADEEIREDRINYLLEKHK